MRWLFIGDSILDGMAPSIASLYRSRRPRDSVTVLANSGWSTRRWLLDGQVASRVADERPDVVVVALGTNDEGEEGNAEGYGLVVDHLKAQASSRGAKVYWVTSFSGPGSAERYQVIRGVLGDERTISGLALMSGVEMAGEIHPSVVGYPTLAKHMLDAVWSRVVPSSHGGVFLPLAIGAVVAGVVLWWTEA